MEARVNETDKVLIEVAKLSAAHRERLEICRELLPPATVLMVDELIRQAGFMHTTIGRLCDIVEELKRDAATRWN